MTEQAPSTTSSTDLEKIITAEAKKKSIAVGFLKRANRKQYGGLWSELENGYTRGVDHYHANITGAYNLLLNYKPAPQAQAPNQVSTGLLDMTTTEITTSSMSLVQASAPITGNDGATYNKINCYNCNNTGHNSNQCPQDRNRSGVQLLQASGASEVEVKYRSGYSSLSMA